MKKLLLIFAHLFVCSFFLHAQIVTIPDANFKAALVSDIAINSNIDSEIQVSEAIAYTGTINVDNKNISDLTGIEAFVNLTQLQCNNNNLATINISSNTLLTSLSISQNQLTTIDVSNNTNLTGLSTEFNLITSINVSNNISLNLLFTGFNPITSININTNTNLTQLRVTNTQITSINISNNILLTQVYAQNTQLSSLDLTNNNNLQVLWVDSNANLSTFNVKNGNNTAIFSFQAQANPNLTCITVDDTAWSAANWTMIDPIASFSTNCSVGIAEMEQNNAALSLYPNPATARLTINVANQPANLPFAVTVMDYTGKIVLQTNSFNYNSIDVSNLANGMYQLQLQNNHFMATQKVVIAK